MHAYHTFIALELANERAREADRQRLVNLARAARPHRSSLVRRGLGRGAGLVHFVASAVARKIDSYKPEDLIRARSSTE